jgi:hypothetical protein
LVPTTPPTFPVPLIVPLVETFVIVPWFSPTTPPVSLEASMSTSRNLRFSIVPSDSANSPPFANVLLTVNPETV